jgi:hypothetical protein
LTYAYLSRPCTPPGTIVSAWMKRPRAGFLRGAQDKLPSAPHSNTSQKKLPRAGRCTCRWWALCRCDETLKVYFVKVQDFHLRYQIDNNYDLVRKPLGSVYPPSNCPIYSSASTGWEPPAPATDLPRAADWSSPSPNRLWISTAARFGRPTSWAKVYRF